MRHINSERILRRSYWLLVLSTVKELPDIWIHAIYIFLRQVFSMHGLHHV